MRTVRFCSKIYLSLGALSLFGVLMAASVFLMTRHAESLHEDRQNSAHQIGRLSTTMTLERMRNAESLFDLLFRAGAKAGEKETTPINLSYEKIDTIYESVLRSATDDVVVDLVESIQLDDLKRLRPLEKQILQSISDRDTAGAERTYSNEYFQARAEHQLLLNKLGDRAALLAQASVEDEPLQVQFIVAVVGLLTGLALLAYGLAHYLTRSFTSPINRQNYVAMCMSVVVLK